MVASTTEKGFQFGGGQRPLNTVKRRRRDIRRVGTGRKKCPGSKRKHASSMGGPHQGPRERKSWLGSKQVPQGTEAAWIQLEYHSPGRLAARTTQGTRRTKRACYHMEGAGRSITQGFSHGELAAKCLGEMENPAAFGQRSSPDSKINHCLLVVSCQLTLLISPNGKTSCLTFQAAPSNTDRWGSRNRSTQQ